MKLSFKKDFQYKRITEPISCYTTTYNCVKLGLPFEESIKSWLPIATELVVVDGGSTDGTREKLDALQEQYPDQLQIYENEFDHLEPGVDGIQKSFSRALCSHNYLIQFDCDEFAHENDIEKWKFLTKRFPSEAKILHLPVVELWGDLEHATYRRHCWKWRMSQNDPIISHGINKHARLTHPETGKVYAQKGASDGCEYIDVMTYEPMPHVGFYNQQIEMARLYNPEEYGKMCNQIFQQLPSAWHTSWLSLDKKVEQLKPGGTWDRLWSLLYQEEAQNRFPDTDFNDQKQVDKLIKKLYNQGGEDSDKIKGKFKLDIEPPQLLKEWYEKK